MSYLKEQYGFVLDWTDLPEDFREEKIDEMVEYNEQNGNYTKGEPKEGKRDQAEKEIARHFPFYF